MGISFTGWKLATLASLGAITFLLLVAAAISVILGNSNLSNKTKINLRRVNHYIFPLFFISGLSTFLLWIAFFVDLESGWRYAALALLSTAICLLSIFGMLCASITNSKLFWSLLAICIMSFIASTSIILESLRTFQEKEGATLDNKDTDVEQYLRRD